MERRLAVMARYCLEVRRKLYVQLKRLMSLKWEFRMFGEAKELKKWWVVGVVW
jgi:hypothetical protein